MSEGVAHRFCTTCRRSFVYYAELPVSTCSQCEYKRKGFV